MRSGRWRTLVGSGLVGLGAWQAIDGVGYLAREFGERWAQTRRAAWTRPERERLEDYEKDLGAVVCWVADQTPRDATVWCVGPSEPDHLRLIGALQFLLWPRWFHSVEALTPRPPRLTDGRETFLLGAPPLPPGWQPIASPVGEAYGQGLWRLDTGSER